MKFSKTICRHASCNRCFPTTSIDNRSRPQTSLYLSISYLSYFRDRRTFFADDIFTHLNDVANETNNLPAGLTINGIAASWINRDRVPLVTVIRDYDTGKINLSQVNKSVISPQGRVAPGRQDMIFAQIKRRRLPRGFTHG